MGLARRDLAALFLAMAHVLPALPGLAERGGVPQRCVGLGARRSMNARNRMRPYLTSVFVSSSSSSSSSFSSKFRRVKHYAVSWARFLGAVLLCLLHTHDKWNQ